MNYTYNTILEKAQNIKNNVEKNYKLGESTGWSYYIAKEIIQRTKTVPKIGVKGASKSEGNDFGRQISKDEYLDMAKRLTAYVEKHNQLPNNIKIGNKLMRVSDYTYMFARILVYYDNNKKLPSKANVNSKAFTKPTEYPNKVYGLWVKYIKTKPKYLDDVCDYIKAHFTYEFYYDDQKSNEDVLKTKAGNCTDLLQMLSNMADAMDYDFEIIHTQCKQSGVGHVYGRFKKKGTNNWFTRDIACIADESRYCVWCEVPNGGNLIARNPSWFYQNLHR
jgi:hypothetical protein